MLLKTGDKIVFNDLSPDTRKYLEEELEKIGDRRVRYKFNISNPNMDPEQYNGPVIWPTVWTLHPRKFDIREGKTKATVGIVLTLDDKGNPKKLGKIQIRGGAHGELQIDPYNNDEDKDKFAFLELHPKNKYGKFYDKNSPGLFFRVDELKEAKDNRRIRKLRTNAMFLAGGYSDHEIRDFVSAMNWDETEDIEVLRNKVEELADKYPEEFEKAINGNAIEYKAVAKRALSAGIIEYSALENQVKWGNSGELIAVLDNVLESNKNEVDRFAEWLQTSKHGDAVFAKLKKMLSGK